VRYMVFDIPILSMDLERGSHLISVFPRGPFCDSAAESTTLV
jgi:hypothetical protein